MKEYPRKEIFADENVWAGVRLMVRGGCLSVRGSDRMTWKYEKIYILICYINVIILLIYSKIKMVIFVHVLLN